MVGKSTALVSLYEKHGCRGYAISVGPEFRKRIGASNEELQAIIDIDHDADGYYKHTLNGVEYYVRKKGIDVMVTCREDHIDNPIVENIFEKLRNAPGGFIEFGDLY